MLKTTLVHDCPKNRNWQTSNPRVVLFSGYPMCPNTDAVWYCVLQKVGTFGGGDVAWTSYCLPPWSWQEMMLWTSTNCLTPATWTPTPPQQARGEKQTWRSLALVGCSVSLSFVLPFMMNIEPSRSCRNMPEILRISLCMIRLTEKCFVNFVSKRLSCLWSGGKKLQVCRYSDSIS